VWYGCHELIDFQHWDEHACAFLSPMAEKQAPLTISETPAITAAKMLASADALSLCSFFADDSSSSDSSSDSSLLKLKADKTSVLCVDCNTNTTPVQPMFAMLLGLSAASSKEDHSRTCHAPYTCVRQGSFSFTAFFL